MTERIREIWDEESESLWMEQEFKEYIEEQKKAISVMESFLDEESCGASLLPLAALPAAIQKTVWMHRAAGCLLIGVAVPFLFVWKKESLLLAAAFLVFGLLSLYAAHVRYLRGAAGEYLVFRGIVVDAEEDGFLRTLRSTVITIANEDKTLSLIRQGRMNVRIGAGMTLYLAPDTPILETPYGPAVDNVIAYTFEKTNAMGYTAHGHSAETYLD